MPKTKRATTVFLIRTLTNLHAGSGDSDYGPVDKLVQRDPADRLPTIFSSSIKGAMREHFEEVLGKDPNSEFIRHVFGSPVKNNSGDPTQGQYHFLAADLLALPKPEEDANSTKTYELVCSEEQNGHFVEKMKLLGVALADRSDFGKKWKNSDIGLPKNDPEAFRDNAENLPVIARNKLENGQSENLWYEELVPREAVFGWAVIYPKDSEHWNVFSEALENQVIQIGGNATVGYGFCQFKKIV